MTRPWNRPLDEMSFKNERERIQEELAREMEERSDQTREMIGGWVDRANKIGWHPTTSEAVHAITLKAQIFQEIAWEMRRPRLIREEQEQYREQGL